MRFLDRLNDPELSLTVELRPPRVDQTSDASIDSWFSMHATVLGLLASDVPLFITDGAVGTQEEENLHHLVTNLEADVPRSDICPFLTTKHTLEYCLWYAARASEAGCEALTVLGGDKHVGAPRCVPHGYLLRQAIRERFPTLKLGGWANPHQDAARQVAYLQDAGFTGDFYLTQLVSHVDMAPLDAFMAELQRQSVAIPGVFGVFFYRSARAKTLRRLAKFFPVHVDGVLAEFKAGLSAEAICARTIRELRDRGVKNIYVSNLHPDRGLEQLAAIRDAL